MGTRLDQISLFEGDAARAAALDHAATIVDAWPSPRPARVRVARWRKLSLDLQGEYQVSRWASVFANLRNVNDGTEDNEIAGPSTPPHAQFRQREDFGSLWTFGVRGTF